MTREKLLERRIANALVEIERAECTLRGMNATSQVVDIFYRLTLAQELLQGTTSSANTVRAEAVKLINDIKEARRRKDIDPDFDGSLEIEHEGLLIIKNLLDEDNCLTREGVNKAAQQVCASAEWLEEQMKAQYPDEQGKGE